MEQKKLMRLGWSVLCNDFEKHDDDSLTLKHVFTDAALGVSVPATLPYQAVLQPPVILISFWFTESDLDQNRYPAVLRLLAPGDNQILDEWHFAIDFLYRGTSLTVFYFRELMFVGAGLYEFHIEIPQFGEWTIMAQNSLYVSDQLS